MTVEWVDVGDLHALRFNPGAPVLANGLRLALFRTAQGLVALDHACPHAGAPLCDGSVQDGKVVCFLHCWEFDLQTGQCDVGPQWNVATYPVREVQGRVWVCVPPVVAR